MTQRTFELRRWSFAEGSIRRDLVVLVLLGLMIMAAGLGLRDPWPPDEPRFALVAKEMVEGGSWLFPTRNGTLYPDKPPVFMWCIAGAHLMTGSIRVAFLLPSLLAGLGTVLLVYDLARRLWNRRVGLLAGLALLATLQVVLQARAAQIDAVLTFLTTASLYGLIRHLLLGPAWRWWYLAFAAMGLGVITKGVGFLPALALLPYAWARWRRWAGIPRFRFPWWHGVLGPLTLLAVIAAWLLPMLVAVAASGDLALEAYRDEILFHQTATRYVAAWHHERWCGYFLLEVAPWAWLPLTLAMPWLLPGWWRRLRRHEARTLLLVGWIVLVLLFFSSSPGKRGVYLLPTAPALALAAAPLLPGIIQRRRARATATGALLLFSSVLSLVGLAVLLAPRPVNDALSHYRGEASVVALPLLIIGLGGLFLALSLRHRGPLALAGFFWGMWLVVGWWIFPALNPLRSAAPFMDEVEAALGPGDELAIVQWREQLVLLSDLPITTFGYARRDVAEEARDAATWAVSEERHRWVLVPEQQLDPCFDRSAVTAMGWRHGRSWYLAPAHAVTEACRSSVTAHQTSNRL